MAREFAAYLRLMLSRSVLLAFLLFDAIGVVAVVAVADVEIPGDAVWAVALATVLLGGFLVYRDAIGGTGTANLARDLTASDTDVRSDALATLAVTRTDAARRVLRNAVEHGLPDVRQHAALLLAERGEPTNSAALLEALHEAPDSSLRGRAVDALAHTPTPQVIASLGRAIESDAEKEVRRRALGVIARFPPDVAVDALPAVRSAMREQDLYSLAALTAIRIGDRSALPLVVEHARFDPQVAVQALVAIGDPAIDDLVDLIGDADVAEQALRRLPESWRALGQALSDGSKPPHKRRAAASILGELGPQAISALIAALDDPEVEVRNEAADALRAQGAAACDPVLRLLQSDIVETRLLACRALAWRGNAAAVMPLCEVLKRDGDVSVRCDAARALGEIADARAAAALLERVIAGLQLHRGAYTDTQDPRWPLRAKAIRAVGELDDPRAAEALIPLYLTSHGGLESMRARIREALEQHDTAEIRSALELGAQDAHTRYASGNATDLDDAVFAVESSIVLLGPADEQVDELGQRSA